MVVQGDGAGQQSQRNFDVIIVGGGVAAYYAALCLEPSLKVLLVRKHGPEDGQSASVQGGIAAVFTETEDPNSDSMNQHRDDTLIAGGFKNHTEALKILVNEGPQDVKKLMEYSVSFDRKTDGSFDLALEGGHTHARILHHKDSTAQEILTKLDCEMRKQPNITVWEKSYGVDLKPIRNGFSLTVLTEGNLRTVNGYACLLATGGVGRVYEYTTNSAGATGDGILLAGLAGAKIRHMDWLQFHPTVFVDNSREWMPIPESVRGAGAKILNANKEEFLSRYDKRAELAPRDVISHGMLEEGRRVGDARFYLDFTMAKEEFAKEQFPTCYERLLKAGVSMTKSLIPIYPCQHSLMGGIETDCFGETNVKGLYAAGECAYTGVHGNNRLAGNSILEDIVFARQAASDIQRKALLRGETGNTLLRGDETLGGAGSFFDDPSDPPRIPVPKGIRTQVRAFMQKSGFVNPDPVQVVQSFEMVREIRMDLEKGNYLIDQDYLEARALVNTAYLILKDML